MDDNMLFEKYWEDVVFIDMPNITPSDRDRKEIIQSYGFARFRLYTATQELKKAIIESLPKWLRKWIT